MIGWQKLFGQELQSKKDTVYLVFCWGLLGDNEGDDGMAFTIVVRKDLSFFKDQPYTENEKTFMCAFFRHSILLVDPTDTVTFKNRKLYSYLDDKQYETFFKSQIKILDRLYKSFVDSHFVEFKHQNKIGFSVAKISGEFWLKKINVKLKNINPVKSGFKINPICYNYDYIYDLKQFDEIIELDKDDWATLSKLTLWTTQTK